MSSRDAMEGRHPDRVERWAALIRGDKDGEAPKELALTETLHLVFQGPNFGSCRVSLETNSAELVKKLRHYFKDFVSVKGGEGDEPDILVECVEREVPLLDVAFKLKPLAPGKTKLKEEYVDLPNGRLVRKRLTGMVFVFGAETNVGCGPCERNDNQVINFINNRFIEWILKKGYVLGHAAAVSFQGAGLSMAGMSGMGKSTLALHLMARGTDFVSNDRLMVRRVAEKGGDAGVEMVGVAKLPRINPGTVLNNEALHGVMPPDRLAELRDLSSESIWDLEEKYDVFLDECFGENKFKLSGKMDGLVLLNWSRSRVPIEIREIHLHERRDLLPAFMKSVGLFFYDPGESGGLKEPDEEAYLRVLGACTVFEITGGVDFEVAADACFEYLKTGKMPTGS